MITPSTMASSLPKERRRRLSKKENSHASSREASYVCLICSLLCVADIATVACSAESNDEVHYATLLDQVIALRKADRISNLFDRLMLEYWMTTIL